MPRTAAFSDAADSASEAWRQGPANRRSLELSEEENAASPEPGGIYSAIADEFWETGNWLRRELLSGFASLARKDDPGSRHPTLRRIGRRVLFRLILALSGKLLDRLVHPLAGSVMQLYVEIVHQKSELEVGNYEAARGLLQAFIDLPSGNQYNRELAGMQNLMRPLLPLWMAFDQWRGGGLALAQAGQHLSEVADALASDDVRQALSPAYAAQLLEGLDLLRYLIDDLALANTARDRLEPEAYLATFAQSRLLAAMLPPELAWLAEFFSELAMVFGRIREQSVDGPKNLVEKGCGMASIVFESRLSALFAPQLDAWLRPLYEHMAGRPGEVPISDAPSALSWLGVASNRQSLAVDAQPGLRQTGKHLQSLGRASEIIEGLADFPASAPEQLAWGIEILSNKALRGILHRLFSADALRPITYIFQLLDEAPPRPTVRSLAAEAAWSTALFANARMQAYLAEVLPAGAADALRVGLDWTQISQHLLSLKANRDKDAAWAVQAREALLGLGEVFMAQVSSRTTVTLMANGAMIYSRLRSDPDAVMLFSAFIALRELPAGWNPLTESRRWLPMIWARISQLPGFVGRSAYYLQYIAKGLDLAYRWYRSPKVSELESGLETLVRQIKLGIDATGATALALDLVPLAPALWEAFSTAPTDAAPGASLGQRAMGLMDRLASSNSPAIRRAGASIENTLVNGMADALGASLPEGPGLLENLLPQGVSATPMASTSGAIGSAARVPIRSGAQLRVDGLTRNFQMALVATLLFGGVALISGDGYLRQRRQTAAIGSSAAPATPTRAADEERGELLSGSAPVATSGHGAAALGSLAATSILAAVFSGGMAIYNWQAREEAREVAEQVARLTELDSPLLAGHRTTLAQGIETYIRRTCVDAEAILGDPLRLEAQLVELLSVPRLRHEGTSRRRKRSLGDDTPGEPSQSQLRVVERSDGGVDVLSAEEDVPESTTRPVEGDPEEAASRLTFDMTLRKRQVEGVVEVLKKRAADAGAVPPHLSSFDAFLERDAERIHARHFNRPFDPDEVIPLRYDAYEDNPLVYLAMPVTQPVLAVRKAFASNKGPDAVAKLTDNAVSQPFWNRTIWGNDGRMDLSVRQLLSGQLKGQIGQNTYNINVDAERAAPDQLDAAKAYFEDLHKHPTVERFETELHDYFDSHKSALENNYKRRLLAELNDAVGASDYSPEQRIEQRHATLHPVFARPAPRYKLNTPTLGSPYREWSSHHRVLQAVRYIDASALIDVVVFMGNHSVHDAFRVGSAALTSATDAANWPVQTTSIELTDIAHVAQVLKGTAYIDTPIYDAIASTVSSSERDYAEALRDDAGQRVYNDVFIKRLKSARQDSRKANGGRASSLTLVTERAESLDELARNEIAHTQGSLRHAAAGQTRSSDEQRMDFWAHKFELAINSIATALTVVGALPIPIASIAGRAAWLSAIISSTATTVMRLSAAENVDEQRSLLLKWLTTVAAESMLWLCAEYGVGTVTNRIMTTAPGKAAQSMLSRKRLLELEPFLTAPRFSQYLDNYEALVVSRASPAIRAASDEIAKEVFRRAVETAINSSLVGSAFWGYPALQEAVLQLDWQALDTPDVMAARDPSFNRNSVQRYEQVVYLGKTFKRRLPRNTLSVHTRRSQAWRVVLEGSNLVTRPDTGADVPADSPDNRWIKLKQQESLAQPGRYRNFNGTSYYLLNPSTHWNQYGSVQYRLLQEEGVWRAELLERTAEEAKAEQDRHRQAQARITEASSAGNTSFETAKAWVIHPGQQRYAKIAAPLYSDEENRWREMDNDDPNQAGTYMRIGGRKTYQYIWPKFDRRRSAFKLVHRNGLWKAVMLETDNAYAPEADLDLLRSSASMQRDKLARVEKEEAVLLKLPPQSADTDQHNSAIRGYLRAIDDQWRRDDVALKRLQSYIASQVDDCAEKSQVDYLSGELAGYREDHKLKVTAHNQRYKTKQERQRQWEDDRYATLKRTAAQLHVLNRRTWVLSEKQRQLDIEIPKLPRFTNTDKRVKMLKELAAVVAEQRTNRNERILLSQQIRSLYKGIRADQSREYNKSSPPALTPG